MQSVYEKNEELIKLAKAGDTDAEEQVLLANEKLCYYIAKRFKNTNIEEDDLVSLARIGLFKAYKTFDTDRNIKFATYATRIIQNEILMEIRKNKKHKAILSLDGSISTDIDGHDLTLMETIANPENKFEAEDFMMAQEVFKVFCDNANNRDIQILTRYIMGEETQKEVADSLNISQSYVARLTTSIENRLQYIRRYGKYVKVSPNPNKKEVVVLKKVKRYTKADYIYAFKEYPQLSNKEIGYIMGVVPQSVVNYRSEFKKGVYDNVELTDISKDLIAKLDDFIKNREDKAKVASLDINKELAITPPKVKTKKTALEVSDEIAFPFPKVIEENIVIEPNRVKRGEEIIAAVLSKEEELEELNKVRERIGANPLTSELVINYEKKEEISNKEIIILNNKISLMSSVDEVSSLIYGIYQLLENSPKTSRVKLDLSFEVIK